MIVRLWTFKSCASSPVVACPLAAKMLMISARRSALSKPFTPFRLPAQKTYKTLYMLYKNGRRFLCILFAVGTKFMYDRQDCFPVLCPTGSSNLFQTFQLLMREGVLVLPYAVYQKIAAVISLL